MTECDVVQASRGNAEGILQDAVNWPTITFVIDAMFDLRF
jgi:hypothetical protein